ncbi:peroxiredoxin-like family protein [Desertibaculum subflavum]|uniref:peroxiredoxin-like family protein n=1 Tax=Desertibaculum subflavum TaxID=2268458 RepID=UPI000E6765A7
MGLRAELASAAGAARRQREPGRQAMLDLALARIRASGTMEGALQEGETAPDFELPDGEGMRFSLMRALDEGPAVLMFYRGSWCPYCRIALEAYDAAASEFRRRGAALVAISGEHPALPEVRERLAHLKLRRLFDFDHRVARLFDLVFPMPDELVAFSRAAGLDTATIGSSGRWELPLPATYLIGTDGIVDYAHVEADFTQRAEPEEVLARIDRLSLGRPASG